MLPNFIGIGAPKAGTTWIFKYINQHPEIYIPSAKEITFFSEPNIDGRLSEYESWFSDANISLHKAVGEISTTYLNSVYAPERVKQTIPDVKLFVCLRNPIEQTYSLYWHLLRQNFHLWQTDRIPSSFEDSLEKFESMLLHQGLYYQHLQNWLTHFDRSQLHIVFFDDIVSEPQNVMSDIFSFLNVDCSFVPDVVVTKNSSTRQGVSPKNTLFHNTYKLIYDISNKYIYVKLKQLIGLQQASKVKDLLKIPFIFEKVFFKKNYTPMNPDTRKYLRSYFSNDIRKLEVFANRSLEHWL